MEKSKYEFKVSWYYNGRDHNHTYKVKYGENSGIYEDDCDGFHFINYKTTMKNVPIVAQLGFKWIADDDMSLDDISVWNYEDYVETTLWIWCEDENYKESNYLNTPTMHEIKWGIRDIAELAYKLKV